MCGYIVRCFWQFWCLWLTNWMQKSLQRCLQVSDQTFKFSQVVNWRCFLLKDSSCQVQACGDTLDSFQKSVPLFPEPGCADHCDESFLQIVQWQWIASNCLLTLVWWTCQINSSWMFESTLENQFSGLSSLWAILQSVFSCNSLHNLQNHVCFKIHLMFFAMCLWDSFLNRCLSDMFFLTTAVLVACFVVWPRLNFCLCLSAQS